MTSTAGFTKGPWRWEDWSEDNGPNRNSLVASPDTLPGGRSKMFPNLGNRLLCDDDNQCSEADKALIAAAPELYEVAQAAERLAVKAQGEGIDMDDTGEFLDLCRAALSKAVKP